MKQTAGYHAGSFVYSTLFSVFGSVEFELFGHFGDFEDFMGRFGLRQQYIQVDAIQVFDDQILQAVPDGHGRAGALARAFFAAFEARVKAYGAFQSLGDAQQADGFGGLAEAQAAAWARRRLNQAGLHQGVSDLMEKRQRDFQFFREGSSRNRAVLIFRSQRNHELDAII